MNGQSHIIVDDALIGKYLSGEATPEEAIAVDDWLQQSAENSAAFSELAAIWYNASGHTPHQAPDKTAAWQEIRQRMPAARVIRSNKGWWAIAAGIILIVACFGIIQLFKQKPADVLSPVIVYAANEAVTDTMPDHSIVTLSKESRLQYPADFNIRTRELQLEGEAFFDVTPNPALPFIVHAGDISIKVLGTSFKIDRQPQGIVKVAVQTGAVSMYHTNSQLTVKAGQTGIYDPEGRRLYIEAAQAETQAPANAARVFDFHDAKLEEIMEALGKAYGFKPVFKNEELRDCRMSSEFEDKPLEYVLDIVSTTLNVQIQVKDKVAYISGEGCN
ncbi:MAG TPA: FecR domain-containing protein [Chitinophaga sp.]